MQKLCESNSISMGLIYSFLLVAFASASATAKEEPDDALATVLESIVQSSLAVQTKRDGPKYPISELRRGREAWVHVTYCIDESGVVQNVSILDSIGSTTFDKEAIRTVENWEFEPAIQDGRPSWQSRNEIFINFAIEDSMGASKKFIRQFRKLGDLIEANKLEDADKLFWHVYETYDLGLYELGKLWSQRVRYEALAGDYFRLHLALQRATASRGSWIERESYQTLLKLRIQVEIQLGKYSRALESFDELIDSAGDDANEIADLRPTIDRLRSMIDGDEMIQINAEIRKRGECTKCNNSWDFTPVRRDFTLTSIQGTLGSLDMRCDNKRFEAKVVDLIDWHIPEKWGKCHIQVYGEPGTTFEVIMLPANAS